MLERLLARLPNLRPAGGGGPEQMEHFFMRGFTSLPIAWDVEATPAAAE